jgi:hypothetical protein
MPLCFAHPQHSETKHSGSKLLDNTVCGQSEGETVIVETICKFERFMLVKDAVAMAMMQLVYLLGKERIPTLLCVAHTVAPCWPIKAEKEVPLIRTSTGRFYQENRIIA